MKIVVAVIAALVAAPVAMALSAFMARPGRAASKFPAFAEDELGT